MGQLLVVARHTDTSPSSCYEPELIPDPIVCNHTSSISDGAQLDLGLVLIPDHSKGQVCTRPGRCDLGSVIVDCENKHYNLGRDFGAEMGLYNA